MSAEPRHRNPIPTTDAIIAGPDGRIVNDHVVTAYLRGNVRAAINLRDSLDKAILLAQQTGAAH